MAELKRMVDLEPFFGWTGLPRLRWQRRVMELSGMTRHEPALRLLT